MQRLSTRPRATSKYKLSLAALVRIRISVNGLHIMLVKGQMPQVFVETFQNIPEKSFYLTMKVC